MTEVENLINAVKGKELPVKELCLQATLLSHHLLNRALILQTSTEKYTQDLISGMLDDPKGKAFLIAMTDQCFRSSNPRRIMDQFRFLIHKYGIPKFLSADKKFALKSLAYISSWWARPSAALLQFMLRHATRKVILPGEPSALARHMKSRLQQGFTINLNHLGEAILGENEVKRRLAMYINDLAKDEVGYISVKISTLCSQINLLAKDQTLSSLKNSLRALYRTAQQHFYTLPGSSKKFKFINLDMEEYKDLNLTVEAFCSVLSEPEFVNLSAGVALQSYIPDSFGIQQQITEWAMERYSKGGAPIKIRIVKGANLAMEQVIASISCWPQAPYSSKSDADANYKKMLLYGFEPDHIAAVHIGVASHNLFDISFALLLRSMKNIEPYVSFEMLEGMAEHIQRAVQEITPNIVLYCPAVDKNEFQNAMGYFIRRLDENSAPENFLHCLFNLSVGSSEWLEQQKSFLKAASDIDTVAVFPRRTQDRLLEAPIFAFIEGSPFENEPNTDWALTNNCIWGNQILANWQKKSIDDIPLCIAGSYITTTDKANGIDPSNPSIERYHYSLASVSDINQAVSAAEAAAKEWRLTTPELRAKLLLEVAKRLRLHRGTLIGTMVLDGGKTIYEADAEISEAIDFAEYYGRNYNTWSQLPDVKWSPKGVVLVLSPWNFPCSIPAGCILAALMAGNAVIFKPAPEAPLVGWELVKIFWDAGIDKNILQYINCIDDPVGSELIKNTRISTIMLTGATSTAQTFLKLRPAVDLIAETGGKNAIIVTAMADADLAVKDIIYSAFGHSGQKCSACSLAIIESELYDSPHFQNQLRDAACSLFVGSPWDPASIVTPLIRNPGPELLRALTTLEPGESWLLKPICDKDNAHLWSPGIKLGVTAGSFTHQTELFGPVLGLMRAKDLHEAIKFANGTPYGLTTGIFTLDPREKVLWLSTIEAGNCYVNRSITGAIVQRQPFGGCKASSFGRGLKAGGPNYLSQLMTPTEEVEEFVVQVDDGKLSEIPPKLVAIDIALQRHPFSERHKALWLKSAQSYAYYWSSYFQKQEDPSQLIGQENLLLYKPYMHACIRMSADDHLIDLFRFLAASVIVNASLEISGHGPVFREFVALCSTANLAQKHHVILKEESDESFAQRIIDRDLLRFRMTSKPTPVILDASASAGCNLIIQPILANGRIELLNFLREVSLSNDYHRYGNLYDRDL